jgi:hypothetical protein
VLSPNTNVDIHEEATSVISQKVQPSSSAIKPSLQETIAAKAEHHDPQVQVIRKEKSNVPIMPSQEATIVIPLESKPLLTPKPDSPKTIFVNEKLSGKKLKLVGGLGALIFLLMLGIYWAWHVNSNTSIAPAKTETLVADKPIITSDKATIAKPQGKKIENRKTPASNDEIPVKVSEEKGQAANDINESTVKSVPEPPKSSTSDYSKKQIPVSPSTPNSEPSKDSEMVASKLNPTEPSKVQSNPSKTTFPSPLCRSLTESFQLGDPSITPQRIKQACEQ